MQKFRISWIVALLALGLVAFGGLGCSDDDDDDDDDMDHGLPAPTLTAGSPSGTVDLGADDPEIAWNEVADAYAYQVQVAATDDFAGASLIIDETFEYDTDDDEAPPTSYNIQINLLTFGETYYYRVRAQVDEDFNDDVAGEWTNWTDVTSFQPEAPDVTGYDRILEGTIGTTMINGNETVLLRGGVFVQDGATLTINAGAQIHGENATDGMLVIMQGGKIEAHGTAENPIIMQSDLSAQGQGARGQWGGLIINGRASLNTGTTAIGEGGTGTYGGTNDADNSGTLRYVVVAYAGREISPDNELNGIAFQGVGSGTTVEYVQVHMNKDDGVEFFGGTVNAKYIYCTGIADDSFDWTDGWRGKGQFWVGQQYGDDADQGFENDSNGDDEDATPFSEPTIYNFTLVGDRTQDESDYGMLIRAGAKGYYYNGIVMNFNELGIDVDDDQTAANISSDEMTVEYTLFYNNAETWATDDDGIDEEAFITAEARNNYFDLDPSLTDPLNVASPDFSPMTGGNADTLAVATPPDDGFFDSTVDFLGGMAPGDNWIAGWTIGE